MALTPKLVERAYLGDQIIFPKDSWPMTRPMTVAWWRSDIRRMLTLDANDKVTSWKDMIGGRIMAQATEAARPQYAEDSFSGAPGVYFNLNKFLELGVSPWPINQVSSMMVVVCDQIADPSDTTMHVLASYGNTAVAQRKVIRTSREGVNRGGFEIGNTWTTDIFEQSRVDFSGAHSVVAYFGDVSSTASLDDSIFSGVSSLALRTATGRTRIGADSEDASPSQFCNAIIRDVLIIDPSLMGSQDFFDLQEWANKRRVPW